MASTPSELRAYRLARDIAQLGMLSERTDAIVRYGNARFQEGVESAAADRDAREEGAQAQPKELKELKP